MASGYASGVHIGTRMQIHTVLGIRIIPVYHPRDSVYSGDSHTGSFYGRGKVIKGRQFNVVEAISSLPLAAIASHWIIYDGL